jgi:two-component system phosphate regulon sensor histidine kinase PhoR
VQGYIDTLIDGAVKNKELRTKYLERAQKGVERLVYIVEDLDMISRLEMGELNLEYKKFDIVNLIQNVFDLLEMQADKKNIILMFDRKYRSSICVNADQEKIQQVLTNLIMNSIKYGKENGTTEITIEDLVKDKIIVRVRDNGEGIEKQNISRLFERFYRVDKSGSRDEGGSGLGLSIVKHIIERHNEKIYVESEFGKGSEFSFTLEKC